MPSAARDEIPKPEEERRRGLVKADLACAYHRICCLALVSRAVQSESLSAWDGGVRGSLVSVVKNSPRTEVEAAAEGEPIQAGLARAPA